MNATTLCQAQYWWWGHSNEMVTAIQPQSSSCSMQRPTNSHTHTVVEDRCDRQVTRQAFLPDVVSAAPIQSAG